jgi:predicted  nucleic acid-binding Zn-ribbon protein
MSKSARVVKYKVINTNIDKKFIGKDLDLQKVESKDGYDEGERKPSINNKITLSKLSNKVDSLSNDLNRVSTNLNKLSNDLNVLTNNLNVLTNNFNVLTNNLDNVTNNLNKLSKIVTDGFAEQAKFNKQQLEFNKTIINRIDNLVKVNNLKE